MWPRAFARGHLLPWESVRTLSTSNQIRRPARLDLAFPQRPSLPGRFSRTFNSFPATSPRSLFLWEGVGRAEALPTFHQIRRPARWIWLSPKGRACPADGESMPDPVSARESRRIPGNRPRSNAKKSCLQIFFATAHSPTEPSPGRECGPASPEEAPST